MWKMENIKGERRKGNEEGKMGYRVCEEKCIKR